MIQRTYIAKLDMPEGEGPYLDLDILPFGPVGTRLAPVSAAPGSTTPPSGWVAACGNGFFYEIRGRAIPKVPYFGASGFTPLFNLGWNCVVQPYATDISTGRGANQSNLVPIHGFSQTIIGDSALSSGIIHIGQTDLADQSYGPVIRLFNNANIDNGVYIVHLNIFDQQEEDIRRP